MDFFTTFSQFKKLQAFAKGRSISRPRELNFKTRLDILTGDHLSNWSSRDEFFQRTARSSRHFLVWSASSAAFTEVWPCALLLLLCAATIKRTGRRARLLPPGRRLIRCDGSTHDERREFWPTKLGVAELKVAIAGEAEAIAAKRPLCSLLDCALIF